MARPVYISLHHSTYMLVQISNSKFTKNVISKLVITTRARSDTRSLPYYEGPLEGTAPYRGGYVLLHTHDRPSEFPKVYESPLSRELLARATRWPVAGGVAVNFAWMKEHGGGHVDLKSTKGWPSHPATVFSPVRGRLDIPDITFENLDKVERQIVNHLDHATATVAPGNSKRIQSMSENTTVDVYVCTHAARDCRCGERGLQVYEALVRTVEAERIQSRDSLAHRIRIGAVGHVGGHQYAANVLIFPHGEWLGCVKPEDATWIAQKLMDDVKNVVHPLSPFEPPFSLVHWRGRMGMTQEQMKTLYYSSHTRNHCPLESTT